CVLDPGRSTEHNARTDEDVPHASGSAFEGRRYRRHHADRPSRRAEEWSEGCARHPARDQRARVHLPRGDRRRAPPDRAGHRRGVRTFRAEDLMPVAIDVFVANEQSDVPLDEHRLVSLARLAAAEEDVDPRAEVTVLLVDRPAMTALKERWLGEPGPTDVLAFPMDEQVPEDEPYILGDIVICPD